MDGIIVLNKPAGFTSMDCCAVIRRICGEKKAGHTGTLDPNATGVLPVCLGKATRLIEYMDGSPKQYRCQCQLGKTTDTQDIWGKILTESSFQVTRQEIETVLASFLGEIEQIPPAYSAVKINGKKLYQYAREGQRVEVPSRKVTIHRIDLIAWEAQKGTFTFDILCSRGTYVRTICADLGNRLGCGAVMTALVRTSACGYDLSEAVSLDVLKDEGPEKYLRPVESAVSFLPSLQLSEWQAHLFVNGVSDFVRNQDPSDRRTFSVWKDKILLGTAAMNEDGILKVCKVLRQ